MHVIGTAGHVDHGKSTLVRRLTGIDPDRFEEEKRRGLTIDLGFAWFELPSGTEVGMVDVPGHERFVANMLAGAGGITTCLFVVAANEGWKPQSAEHLSIIDLLGVRHGVVALTKTDIVDPETVEIARAEVEEKLAVSSLAGAAIVGCSAVTGEGLDELVAELDRVLSSAPGAPDLGRPRLWVDRVFTIAGAGTVVTGTLAGGSFSSGEDVEISPEGRAARIRKIQSHKKEVASAHAGSRTALNLAGLERQGAERGDAIVRASQWHPTSVVDAVVRVLPGSLAGTAHTLTEKGSHLLYAGTAEMPVRIKLMTGDAIGPGEEGLARLYLRGPLPLARGDRFVLRDAGRVLTFGGGRVLDPLPPARRRKDEERAAFLQEWAALDGVDALETLVEAEGEGMLEELSFRSGLFVSPNEPLPGAMVLGPRVYSPQRFSQLKSKANEIVATHHDTHPLEKGIGREVLRAALELDADVFDAFLARAEGLRGTGNVVSSASHEVALGPEQQVARDDLVAKLDAAGFQPPFTKELGVDATLLRALTESAHIVRVGDFYLSGGRAAEARTTVRSAIEERGPLTVAEIRDLLGTTRKYAVPLCEWLDSTGATARHGDLRHLGPHP